MRLPAPSLLLLQGRPRVGAQRTPPGTEGPSSLATLQTPLWDGAAQDSPLTDQSPCSPFQKPGGRSPWKSCSHPLQVQGLENAGPPHLTFQTPCRFFLWLLHSCLSFPHVTCCCWTWQVLGRHETSPPMSCSSTKAAFPGLTYPRPHKDFWTWKA